MLYGGGRIFFGEKKAVNNNAKFYLEPGFNFHYVIGSKPQVMVSTRFAMKETFFVGVGYRSLNTMMIEGGFTIKKAFSINYAYDMAAGNVRRNVGQVHEIGMKFMFNRDFWSY
ncbi:MAG: type IX secretion system membrane protein PorP/SprF [Chitinophagales bacterium]|nr:type IX secretion system membrane protein PorP/SprF [Chitinophagales bacterium]